MNGSTSDMKITFGETLKKSKENRAKKVKRVGLVK